MIDFSKTLRSLFPAGQVFRFFAGSTFRLFIDSLAEMPERIITHADLVRDAGIPGYIPVDALSDWESFLNLMPDTALSTLQRQQRISGKMAKSGGQAWEYVQDVLQQAGFPVYVYENLENELSARVYTSALGNMQLGEVELGEFSGRIDPRSLTGHLIYGAPVWITLKNYVTALGNIQMNEGQLGDYNGTETTVAEYTIPPTASRFIFIWFISGPDGIHDIVDIPAEREVDFRKLVESIKPVHTWAIAQVNFI